MKRSRHQQSKKIKHSKRYFFDPTLSIQHLKALADWISEAISRQYDQTKESLYQMNDDIRESWLDFKNESSHIQQPTEKSTAKRSFVQHEFFATPDTDKQAEYSAQDTSWFCGLDCSLFKMR